MPSKTVIQALAVTCELTGTQISEAAARVMAQDLDRYPERHVLGALERCRKELRGRLTIADVIARLDDGRPQSEEAWAMLPKDEAGSCFWTEEMRQAYAIARALIVSCDLVQARMAFLEAYRSAVLRARDDGTPVQWTFSPGTDKSGRELVILDAVEKGRLSAEHAMSLLPYHREDEGLNTRLLELATRSVKKLASLQPAPACNVRRASRDAEELAQA